MCAKRLAEELNEGFIEDYSTPSKKPRTEQLDTPSKRQKNSYTLEFKLKLVEEAKKLSIAAISKRHSIDRKCIRTWIQKEKDLKKLPEDQKKELSVQICPVKAEKLPMKRWRKLFISG